MNQPTPPRARVDDENPLWSFLKFLGRFINFANTLVFNLVMLALLVMLIALAFAISAANQATAVGPLRDDTALVIDLEGTLVEQFTASPIERAFAKASGNTATRELQLRDLLKVLDKA
jgi:protease-4